MLNPLATSLDIKGDVITPAHSDYDSSIARWAKNAERKAQVVAFVKDTEDIAKSLAHAKANDLLIAIRGGGHNSAGASSAEDGIVIDLSRYLNHVHVDEENRVAYVGGGALWRDVDAEVMKYGLATVGGTINHAGWLSGKHGLTIDNLKQVTIVTADGSILVASEDENPDLFWAIRGGGSNFGIVSEFVLALNPQRKAVFAGPIIFTLDKFEQLVKLTKAWYQTISENEGMFHVTVVGPKGEPVIAAILFYDGSEEEGRNNFKDFLELGPVADHAKEIPYEQLNTLSNESLKHGYCYYLRGFSHKPTDYQSVVLMVDKMTRIHQEGVFTPTVMFEYFPLAKVNSVPIATTAFRRQLTPSILTVLRWDAAYPEKAAEAKILSAGLEGAFLRAQDGLNNSDKLGYTNYGHDVEIPAGHLAHPSLVHVATRSQLAFGPNYARLQSLKEKYDPECIFNRWYPISPAS
ncbi:FAD binding domain-containing protein [Coprinellus micaceus]|uniref:FAD binding domain-containing protein n=1 Tax=Coprinellus micaceus TaxID=71717 RepID=A0A4Y7SR36_COPMI|nr:FAD binding domain-containing protein [Coprinellus micaceus]